MSLEAEFHGAMVNIYWQAKKECNYTAKRFLQLVLDQSGLQAARTLLAKNGVSDGFTALWECGRLDLTMEALVLNAKFSGLFTTDERAVAAARLQAYGYTIPAK